MPSPDFSPPLLHPPWFFPKNKKRLELEEVGRKASARGPQLLPRRRVRGGPEPVAPSVGPFVRPLLLNWGEGTPGRVSAAAVASELYPQIKKKGGEKKKPQHSHHSHLQPSCAYYYFRNNLFNKNSCVSNPLPLILGSPPPFNNNLDNKNDLLAGQSTAAFFLPQLARASALLPLGREREEGARGWEWGASSLLPASRPSLL